MGITRYGCQRLGAPTAPCWWTRHVWSVHASCRRAAVPARAPRAHGWSGTAFLLGAGHTPQDESESPGATRGKGAHNGGGDSWGDFKPPTLAMAHWSMR
jgi:hypothetical protein